MPPKTDDDLEAFMDSDYDIGAVVQDTKTNDKLVIVHRPGTIAEEHLLWETMDGDPDTTVLSKNPDVPADTPVFEVVYLDDLNTTDSLPSDWTFESIVDAYTPPEENPRLTGALTGIPVKVYAFPKTRLKPYSEDN